MSPLFCKQRACYILTIFYTFCYRYCNHNNNNINKINSCHKLSSLYLFKHFFIANKHNLYNRDISSGSSVVIKSCNNNFEQKKLRKNKNMSIQQRLKPKKSTKLPLAHSFKHIKARFIKRSTT